MNKVVRILCLATLGLTVIVLAAAQESTEQEARALNPSKIVRASYKGVRFTFDSSLAASVKSETIPEMAHGKPSDLVPEHPLFTMLGYPRNDPEAKSAIRVFRLDKFREAVATASGEYARSVIRPPKPPDWTLDFDKEVRVLKLLLASKPSVNVGRFLGKARGEKGCGDMPFLPMWEACQAFTARVRYVDFKNGKGVLFLTQWDRETFPITNQGLEYAYQGITDDGKHYVSAEFSVAAPFLPNGSEPEILEWAEKNYLLSHESKEYQSYLSPVLKKLEALPADQFRPSLDLLEELVKSLQIDTNCCAEYDH